ncbi:MAG: LysR family transcriptional regulator [Rhizobiaceae bacterium]|nr:LysR family transcriptional regulator [Rhizobiaceae bacterium]MBL4732103.1 LysR family transcriptional regulator [Rhizobiaceae bacterium]
MKKLLTLRQIEVIRAVMISGSIAGAARVLNVAQPGVSRTMKHLEASLEMKLFVREGGRYVPAPEARVVFAQLQEVHQKLQHLQLSVERLRQGSDVELAIGSVPSIANVMVPKAIAALKRRHPDIRVNIELLKIEEAIDYLMLGQGEAVCMSHKFEHPSVIFQPLAKGRLMCLVPKTHPLAKLPIVSAAQIAEHPLVGIDPNDPFGGILAKIFIDKKLDFDIVVRARFGTTVVALVRENLGVAVLDNFTMAELGSDSEDLALVPIDEDTQFQTYVAIRRDRELSNFAKNFIDLLAAEMRLCS